MTTNSAGIEQNVIANYLGQGWAALMAILFLPIYVASLGFEAYGLIGFFAVLQSTLAFFDFGITATLMREAAIQRSNGRTTRSLRDLVRSYELIAAVSNIFLALMLWLFAERLAYDWINSDQMKLESVAISISLMGLVVASRLQEGVYRGVLMGLGKQVVFNVTCALFATARYAGAAMLLQYGSAGIVGFFFWQVIVSLLNLLVLAILSNRCLPISDRKARFCFKSLRSVWRFSAGMAVVTGFSIAMVTLDKLIFSSVLSLAEFGRYSLASAAAGILYLFVIPITQGFYPNMMGAYVTSDRSTLIRLHHISSQLITVLAGATAIVFIYFANPILYVWSGNAELANLISPLLVILSAAALANCLGYIGFNLRVIKGDLTSLALTSGGAVLLALTVLPITAEKYGLLGGALGWLGIAVLYSGVLLVLAHIGDLKGEGLRWLTLDTLMPLLGSAMIAWPLFRFMPEVGGRLMMGIYLVAATCVILMTASVIAPDLRAQVRSFFNR